MLSWVSKIDITDNNPLAKSVNRIIEALEDKEENTKQTSAQKKLANALRQFDKFLSTGNFIQPNNDDEKEEKEAILSADTTEMFVFPKVVVAVANVARESGDFNPENIKQTLNVLLDACIKKASVSVISDSKKPTQSQIATQSSSAVIIQSAGSARRSNDVDQVVKTLSALKVKVNTTEDVNHLLMKFWWRSLQAPEKMAISGGNNVYFPCLKHRIDAFGQEQKSGTTTDDKVLYHAMNKVGDVLAAQQTSPDSVSTLAHKILSALFPQLVRQYGVIVAHPRSSRKNNKLSFIHTYRHFLSQIIQIAAAQFPPEHASRIESACHLLYGQTQAENVFGFCKKGSGIIANDSKYRGCFKSGDTYANAVGEMLNDETLPDSSAAFTTTITEALYQQRYHEAKSLFTVFSRVHDALTQAQKHWKKSTWYPCIDNLITFSNDEINKLKDLLQKVPAQYENDNNFNTVDNIYQHLAHLYHRLISVRLFLEQEDIKPDHQHGLPPSLSSAVYKSVEQLSSKLKQLGETDGSYLYEFLFTRPSEVSESSPNSSHPTNQMFFCKQKRQNVKQALEEHINSNRSKNVFEMVKKSPLTQQSVHHTQRIPPSFSWLQILYIPIAKVIQFLKRKPFSVNVDKAFKDEINNQSSKSPQLVS